MVERGDAYGSELPLRIDRCSGADDCSWHVPGGSPVEGILEPNMPGLRDRFQLHDHEMIAAGIRNEQEVRARTSRAVPRENRGRKENPFDG